jgi:Cu(I)/Ag(I) efflux system periplasmic protein CusF
MSTRRRSLWVIVSLATLALPLTTSAADTAEAEVRKIDLEGAKITLKHGEIKSLDMPPMTMVFVVKDKGTLQSVKVGDRVRFVAIKDGGRYLVTQMDVVK